MATQDYAASIQGVSIRVTRLDASGNLLNTPGDSYTTSGFTRLSFTPEYADGDEIVEKGADGTIKVTYKAATTLKRITMELAITEPDPELTQMLSGGLLLRKNTGTFASPVNKSIGWSSVAVGDDPAGYGVAIETWSNAILNGKREPTFPYFHWVFPYAKLRLTGDRVVENGLLATTFQGYGIGNTNFGAGLDGRWEFASSTDRPYAYARDVWAPTGRRVTVTTSLAHNLVVGDTVTVAPVTNAATCAGTFVVVAVPTGTTFTYNTVSTGTIASAVETGTVVCAANSRAVSDIAGQSSPTASNVPGNVNFNADNPVDFIIASSADPLV
jgi:hypothetical protein